MPATCGGALRRARQRNPSAGEGGGGGEGERRVGSLGPQDSLHSLTRIYVDLDVTSTVPG
jgi:hypothetical protein